MPHVLAHLWAGTLLRHAHASNRPPSCPPHGALPTAGGAGGQRGLPRPVLRSQLLYRRAFYLYLMASNLLLRLSWTYKLSPHLREHHLVVFFIVLAEAFRWASCCWRGAAPAVGLL